MHVKIPSKVGGFGWDFLDFWRMRMIYHTVKDLECMERQKINRFFLNISCDSKKYSRPLSWPCAKGEAAFLSLYIVFLKNAHFTEIKRQTSPMTDKPISSFSFLPVQKVGKEKKEGSILVLFIFLRNTSLIGQRVCGSNTFSLSVDYVGACALGHS